MDIQVLGELRVVRDEELCALPRSRKSRALLGYLVATQRPHLRERLCELLWDGPDDPRAALRWSLTKLRAILGAERIEASREHVAFVPDGAGVDLLRMRSAIGAGVDAATVPQLETAASVFRGDLLEGLDLPECFRYQQWCAAERASLRQTRAAILARLTTVLVHDPERALSYARQRVSIEPFSDEAHALTIRLLAAAGEGAEALRHYEHYREMLARELGEAPGQEVENARRTISKISRRPARRSPSSVVPEQPSSLTPVVGRDEELAAMRRSVDAMFANEGSIVLVTGEPGIGKSRFLDELRRHVQMHGGATLSSRAFAAELIRPYGVWIDLLRAIAPDSLSESIRRDLAPLLPELSSETDDTFNRARLFGAVLQLLVHSSAAGLAVVIDDLQWLDDASVALLHYVSREIHGRPILLACGARPGELEANSSAARLIHGWTRERNPLRLELKPLTPAQTGELASAVGASANCERIIAESGGNPLFAIELARALNEGEDALAETLEGLISDRLAQLDADARELVTWAAALGRNFDVEILGRATGMASGSMLAALESLERCSVLRASERDRRGHSYDFVHDLVRQAAYRRISAPRRVLVHRQIAFAFRDTHDADGALAAEIVHHAALGRENELAARACLTAGRRALRLFAYEEAIALARQGIQLAERLSESLTIPLQVDLYGVLVYSRSPSRNPDQLMMRIPALAEEAQRLGFAQAASTAFHLQAVLNEEREHFQAAERDTIRSAELMRNEDPAAAAAMIAATGRCLMLLQRDVRRARGLMVEARVLADEAGIEFIELPLGIGFVHAHDGEYEEAAPWLRRAVTLAGREQDHWREWVAMARLLTMELERSSYEAALDLWPELERISVRMPTGSESPRARVYRALAEYGLRRDEDRRELESGLDRLRAIDSKGDLAFALAIAAEVDLSEGRFADAQSRADEAVTAAEAVGRWSEAGHARALQARLALSRGEVHSAAAILAPALEAARWQNMTASARSRVKEAQAMLQERVPSPGQLRDDLTRHDIDERRNSHGENRTGTDVCGAGDGGRPQ